MGTKEKIKNETEKEKKEEILRSIRIKKGGGGEETRVGREGRKLET